MDTPIKVNHIIVCVIYSNYYQYYEFIKRYKNTFGINKSESHIDFCNCSKYLIECVTVFGISLSNMGININDELYHGIYNDNIILNYLSIKYINQNDHCDNIVTKKEHGDDPKKK